MTFGDKTYMTCTFDEIVNSGVSLRVYGVSEWVNGRVICGTHSWKWDSTIFTMVCDVSVSTCTRLRPFDFDLKDDGLLDSLTLEGEGIIYLFFFKARDHVSKDRVSYRKGLDIFIAMSILNLKTHDSDFRNLFPTVLDSRFRRGMRSSIFRDVTSC